MNKFTPPDEVRAPLTFEVSFVKYSATTAQFFLTANDVTLTTERARPSSSIDDAKDWASRKLADLFDHLDES
jgi:hypothetical protein